MIPCRTCFTPTLPATACPHCGARGAGPRLSAVALLLGLSACVGATEDKAATDSATEHTASVGVEPPYGVPTDSITESTPAGHTGGHTGD